MCETTGVTAISISDLAFVEAPPADVAALVANGRSWRRWFRDLDLVLREDRGEKGVRWNVGGPVTGTSEVWLEPSMGGTLVHYFLHADPTSSVDLAAEILARRKAAKVMVFEIKARLEAGRAPGERPASGTEDTFGDPMGAASRGGRS